MARYVALLRGINLGSRNRLSMPDLQALVEQLGGRAVRTYLQSGNVVFSGPKRIGGDLERALAEELGVRSPVIVRSAAQLADVVRRRPFPADGKLLSVTFLAARADPALVRAIDPDGYGADRFVVDGAEVYLHTPGGYGRSKLSNAFWERALRATATTRNWNTVVALTEMAASPL